jgi:hypothetical protein
MEQDQNPRAFTLQERSPFTITLSGDVIFEVHDGALTISLEVDQNKESSERVTGSRTVPLSYFPSPNILINFLQDVKRNFFELMRDNLIDETFLHLSDVSGFAASIRELDAISKQQIIEQHVEKTRDRLTKLLAPIPDSQGRSFWTKHKLDVAVRVAAFFLIKEQKKLTLDAVTAEMRKNYGDNTPASGEALRKQLDLFKIDWMKLKAEVREYVKIRFSG